MNLKRFSGPFDWCSSDIATVLDCLQTDFAHLLDRRHLYERPVDHARPDGKRRCDHRLYPGSFTHHDPIRNPKDYAYFQRCVERWRTLAQCPFHKAFVRFRRPGPRSRDTPRLEDQLFAALGLHSDNFRLLVFHLVERSRRRSSRVVRTVEAPGGTRRMHVVEIHLCGEQDGLKLLDEEDEVYVLRRVHALLQPLRLREDLTGDDCLVVDGRRFEWGDRQK